MCVDISSVALLLAHSLALALEPFPLSCLAFRNDDELTQYSMKEAAQLPNKMLL